MHDFYYFLYLGRLFIHLNIIIQVSQHSSILFKLSTTLLTSAFKFNAIWALFLSILIQNTCTVILGRAHACCPPPPPIPPLHGIILIGLLFSPLWLLQKIIIIKNNNDQLWFIFNKCVILLFHVHNVGLDTVALISTSIANPLNRLEWIRSQDLFFFFYMGPIFLWR